MTITELSVKRPAAVIMFIILTIVLGIFGYFNLGANLFPSVDIPVVTIITTYNGAGPEEIEKDIIKPIEDEISGIGGIDTINSIASFGYGQIVVMFNLEEDMSDVFMDVQQAIANVSSKLPKNASTPKIKRLDLNTMPVLELVLSGNEPYEVIYKYAENTKALLEKLSGVGNVTINGALEKELQIKIDKNALDFYGVAINQVVNKLNIENINLPAGELKEKNQTRTIRVLGEFRDIEDIKNIRIQSFKGGSIPLFEIADVQLEYPEASNILRHNGKRTIGITIQKQSDKNIVEVTELIKEELEKYEKTFNNNVKIVIAKDSSKFIKTTLKDVNKNLLEGILTTSLVMFLFMKRIRSSLIVLIAIPTSLIATFFMMYVLGFTLNIMTLLALSMCIGILVDDSIVVIENIQRHMKFEKNPIKAAIEGRKEIAMAAISITLCDIVVFGPIAFVSGIVGRYFREFGITVVFAALFSLIVSFTITPMLSARFLKKEINKDEEKKKKEKNNFFTSWFENVAIKYEDFLRWTLVNRLKVIFIVGLMILGSIALIPLNLISSEFTPASDEGVITIDVKLNPGANIEKTDEKIKYIENYIKDLKNVDNYFTKIGNDNEFSTASIVVNMLPKKDRDINQTTFAKKVRAWCKTVPGAEVTVFENSHASGGTGNRSPVELNIKGANQTVLKDISEELKNNLSSIPGLTDLTSSLGTRKSEVNINIDHLAVSQYGLSTLEIASSLRTAVNGTDAGVYRKNGDEFDIIVKFGKGQIPTPLELKMIKIMGNTGRVATLSDLAEVKISDSPSKLKRQDRQSTVTITANIESRILGDITNDVEKIVDAYRLPVGYEFTYGSQKKNMTEAFESLILVIIASTFLVYMILVVLYESYLTPFIRMLSLPCGIIGALVALAITQNTLNILTLIGLIMLDGLASKNGTLLIDYTNTLMRNGLPLKEALIMSGTRRLKPIIMTSLTMIVGMIPAAISTGDGSELKSGMAIIIIGGMITSTILTPILLPVVYTLMDDFKNKLKKKRGTMILDGGEVI